MSRTPRSYFDRMYEADPDPWGFECRWYERRKYALTVAALPRERYRSAFEPGCSIGVLSGLLAERCDRLLAIDQVPSAVAAARRRLLPVPTARVEEASVPESWPPGPFDLLVLSEVAYYFDAEELRHLASVAATTLEPGATVVAVHWTGETDYPLTGAAAHEILGATPGWQRRSHLDDAGFVLDVWDAGPGR